MAIIGVNFRCTSGYVTDGTDQTYCLKNEQYPITRGGTNLGYDLNGGTDCRDRDSGNDPRLAGMGANDVENTVRVFYLDLLDGAGSYDVTLALGDPNNNANNLDHEVTDEGTTRIGPITGTVSAGSFVDATGTTLTEANWLTSNTAVSCSFTNTAGQAGATRLSINIDQDTGAGDWTKMSHVSAEFIGSGTTVSSALEALELTTFAAAVSASTNIAASTESLTLSTFSATTGLFTNIPALLEALTLTVFAAGVNAATDITASVESLALSTFAAEVTSGTPIVGDIWTVHSGGASINDDSMSLVLSSGDWDSIKGSNGTPGIFAFGGMLCDTLRNILAAFGGGHGNYAGNDVMSYSITNAEWLRLSSASLAAAGATEDDSKVDGSPNTRHPYTGSLYLSDVDWYFFAGTFTSPSASADGGVWKFDPNTASRSSATAGWTRLAESTFRSIVGTVHDLARELIIAVVDRGIMWYDYGTDAWDYRDTYGSSPFYSQQDMTKTNQAMNPNNNTILVIGSSGQYVWDVSTLASATRSAVTFSGSNTAVVSTKAPGLWWDDTLDGFVAFHPSVSQTSLWYIDPSTWEITEIIAHPDNAVTPALPDDEGSSSYGVYRRFVRNDVTGKYYYYPGMTNGAVYEYTATGLTVSATLESLALTTYTADISLNAEVSAQLESLELTTFTAGVNAAVDIAVELETVTLSVFGAAVSLTTEVSANAESLALDTFPAGLTTPTGINAGYEALTLSVFSASITAAQAALNPGVTFSVKPDVYEWHAVPELYTFKVK